MLARGRERLLDAGIASNVSFCIADAERLPLADQSFDCVTIAFGLRNVTDKPLRSPPCGVCCAPAASS